MRKLALFMLLASLLISCRQEQEQAEKPAAVSAGENRVPVATGIIYDVIVKPRSADDEWENERLAVV
ncbi:MAG: hypothetical protein R2744_05765 [Bacteroidales bacterium]